MVEVTGSLLRFTPELDDDDPNSIPETGTSGSISQGRRDDSIAELVEPWSQSDNIQSPNHDGRETNLWQNTAYTSSEIRRT